MRSSILIRDIWLVYLIPTLVSHFDNRYKLLMSMLWRDLHIESRIIVFILGTVVYIDHDNFF